jgi:cytochrome c oxidase assembly factor CtaG
VASAWQVFGFPEQLAGLIMWVPAGVAHLIAALVIAASWLKEPERTEWTERTRSGVGADDQPELSF